MAVFFEILCEKCGFMLLFVKTYRGDIFHHCTGDVGVPAQPVFSFSA